MTRTETPDQRLEKLLELNLEALPPVMTTEQLAPVLGISADALAQDRYRTDGQGVPFTRIGRRVRYLRADVIQFLVDNRSNGGDTLL